MRCEPHLVARIDSEQEAQELIQALYRNAVIIKGDFECTVASIKIERVGSKQYGDEHIQATAYLPVVRRHENH